MRGRRRLEFVPRKGHLDPLIAFRSTPGAQLIALSFCPSVMFTSFSYSCIHQRRPPCLATAKRVVYLGSSSFFQAHGLWHPFSRLGLVVTMRRPLLMMGRPL